MARVTLGVMGPAFGSALPGVGLVIEGTIQPRTRACSSRINFSSASAHCGGFLCLPAQMTLLLLTDLI